MNDKKFLALSSIFFLLFFAFIALVSLDQPLTQTLRAKTAVPHALKSFVAVFPQVGVAGNESTGRKSTQIKVSVYVRDVNGNGLPNRSVKLATKDDNNIGISPSDTVTTDGIGMAQFFITSDNPGKVTLVVTDVDSGTVIQNVPSAEFTN